VVRDLLYHHRDRNGYIGHGRSSSPPFIHDEYNSVLIENILRRQRIAVKQQTKELEMLKTEETRRTS
jgi:hypothetical protein